MGIRKVKNFSYDYLNDSLYVRLESNTYKQSYEDKGIIFDIDFADNVIGFEILNFSKLSGFSKSRIRNVKTGKIILDVNDGLIRIKMLLVSEYRNKMRESSYYFEKPAIEGINTNSISVSI